MHFTYLEFPSLPQHLTKQVLDLVERPIQNFHDSSTFIKNIKKNGHDQSEEIINSTSNSIYDPSNSLGHPLEDAEKYYHNLALFDFLEVTEEIKQWAIENIRKDILNVSIQVMRNGINVSPHIDEMRSFAYNYVISTGGRNTTTCFYKPKPEFEHLKIYRKTVFIKERLRLIQKIKIEPYCWHRIDTKTIHSVENLNPNLKRISLSLSFL
jgi:hypothetical protein